MLTPRDRRLPLVYAVAIFCSAFLLFQIQPLISKRILPWFGGSPAVWTTCLLFFQTILFAGYAYAHCVNQYLKPRQQAFLHLALVVVALILARAVPSANWEPTGAEHPTSRILLILAVSIGLPYFVLSATGPLLQAWVSRTFPGRIPYRLYALSNVGSLLALASYPFFFEPKFSLSTQGTLWTAGFIVYAILCGYIAAHIFRLPTDERSEREVVPRGGTVRLQSSATNKNALADFQTPSLILSILWLALSAFASLVLIATTNHISTDIAVMPLLWVVPLAIYLVTFILAFDRPDWCRRVPIALLVIISVYGTAVVHHIGMGFRLLYEVGTFGLIASFFGDPTAPPPTVHVTTAWVLFSNFTALFAICLLCHSEIARSRPAPRYLTYFYLMISAGGALGGIFATIVAPLVFTRYVEWNWSFLASCVASIACVVWASVPRWMRDRRHALPSQRLTKKRYGLAAVLALLSLMLSLNILIDVSELLGSGFSDIRWSGRNFFGTLAVREWEPNEKKWNRYELLHGTTSHGSQFTDKSRSREPTTYFGRQSGVGQAIDYFQAHLPPGQLRIGVVGLGAGTLAAYPKAGESITFYEIDPAVIQLAETGDWFTYVRDCRASGATCNIVLGDARLSLQRALAASQTSNIDTSQPSVVSKRPAYHLLVLDAFSGDSIPVHLLTVEAFQIYLDTLLPVVHHSETSTEVVAIAVHISNRFLNLEPVIRAIAVYFNLHYLTFRTPDEPERNIRAAEWVVMTPNNVMANELRKKSTPFDASAQPVLWTDDRSSLFEILR